LPATNLSSAAAGFADIAIVSRRLATAVLPKPKKIYRTQLGTNILKLFSLITAFSSHVEKNITSYLEYASQIKVLINTGKIKFLIYFLEI
jgi:hypothetical protein